MQSPWADPLFFPFLVQGFGGTFQIEKFSFGFFPLGQGLFTHLNGNLINIPVNRVSANLNRGIHIKVGGLVDKFGEDISMNSAGYGWWCRSDSRMI